MAQANAAPQRGASPGRIIDAPTIPLTLYNGLMMQAALAPQRASRSDSAPASSSGPYASVRGVIFSGAVEGENGVDLPVPDTHIAAGASQIVEITNSSIDVFDKVTSGTPAHLASFSENSLVSTGDLLGDGRVLYDPLYDRWIVTFDDFSNRTGAGTNLFICVSKTGDATGDWWIFSVSLSTPANAIFDFPMLGMDQDAILITANLFDGSSLTFLGPSVFAIAKARIYNGFGFTTPIFQPPPAAYTLAPPIVLAEDQNFADYFIGAPVGSDEANIVKWTMQRAGRNATTFSGPISIPVATYTTPPPFAHQTCSAQDHHYDIITLDGRFQNASIQDGGVLWNVQTVNDNGFPTPLWYEFRSDNSVKQSGKFFRSGTSNDFNASIASASGHAAIVTWTSTDASAGKNAMMYIGGRLSADRLGSMTVNPTPLAQTTACRQNDLRFAQRWGDYSAISIDYDGINPTHLYWVVNETVSGTTLNNTWASKIAQVGNP